MDDVKNKAAMDEIHAMISELGGKSI
jgi:hypothetical protein